MGETQLHVMYIMHSIGNMLVHDFVVFIQFYIIRTVKNNVIVKVLCGLNKKKKTF